MTRCSIVAALVLVSSACAPSTHATAFRQATPKSSPAEVEVFTDARPDRPYEEVGAIEVAASELSNSRYGDLIQLATTMPDAWILTSRGIAGTPRITEVIELRLVFAGERAAVVRRRTWIE